MQKHQFLPDTGMKPKEFWARVKRLAKEHQADEVLVYMNLMLLKARRRASRYAGAISRHGTRRSSCSGRVSEVVEI